MRALSPEPHSSKPRSLATPSAVAPDARRPAPSQPAIRLGVRHERWVHAVAGALAATGVLWLVLHYFFATDSDFGPARHPLEPWALRLHGAAAMAFLVVVGTLLPVHVKRAWQMRRNVASGIALAAATALLVVTAYGLYYVGVESIRPWIGTAHWALGLALVPIVLVHAGAGRRGARRRSVHTIDANAAVAVREAPAATRR